MAAPEAAPRALKRACGTCGEVLPDYYTCTTQQRVATLLSDVASWKSNALCHRL